MSCPNDRRKSPFSYANVMSTVGVFIALGGTSYAVTKLPRNSVGSAQVRDRSLQAKDLAAGTVPAAMRGPRGSAGPSGTAGPPGPPGASAASSARIVKGTIASVPASGNYVAGLAVECGAGEAATGGGVQLSGDVNAAQHTYVIASIPIDRAGAPIGWGTTVRNDAARDGFPSASVTVQPWVVCVASR